MEDGGTLAQGLVDYLSGIHHVVLMDNDPEQLQENLFYRNVEYILQIPADFYETCMVNGESLKVTKVPGSYSSFYVDQQISSYLNTIQTYLAAGFPRRKPSRQSKKRLMSRLPSLPLIPEPAILPLILITSAIFLICFWGLCATPWDIF